jgi:hypothetical protein
MMMAYFVWCEFIFILQVILVFTSSVYVFTGIPFVIFSFFMCLYIHTILGVDMVLGKAWLLFGQNSRNGGRWPSVVTVVKNGKTSVDKCKPYENVFLLCAQLIVSMIVT